MFSFALFLVLSKSGNSFVWLPSIQFLIVWIFWAHSNFIWIWEAAFQVRRNRTLIWWHKIYILTVLGLVFINVCLHLLRSVSWAVSVFTVQAFIDYYPSMVILDLLVGTFISFVMSYCSLWSSALPRDSFPLMSASVLGFFCSFSHSMYLELELYLFSNMDGCLIWFFFTDCCWQNLMCHV